MGDLVNQDIYVPGVFECAKCGFRLIQSNLNARDGTVTARDAPGDNCPNDGSPMWRVSWKQYAKDQIEGYDALLGEKNARIEALQAEIDRLRDERETIFNGLCRSKTGTDTHRVAFTRQALKGHDDEQ